MFSLTDIGLGIVQGSGIGPILYALLKSDLCIVSKLNDIFKYADDTTLVVPETLMLIYVMHLNILRHGL